MLNKFNVKELGNYNGLKGKPAYVVITSEKIVPQVAFVRLIY